jgi:thiol-disulfide isomerase/thioredoxin
VSPRGPRALWRALLLGLLLVCSAQAAPPATGLSHSPALEVGDPAPPLTAARWLRGPEIARFEPGQVYVLDFWTVWCPPCIALLPHLSDLQERFAGRGIHFIALTAPDAEANSAAAIEAFLERSGTAVRVPVAYDAPAAPEACASAPLCGVTSLAYLGAAALEGVPVAIVVGRDGRIAWIGDPACLEPVVDAMASDSWDIAAATQRYRAWRQAEPRLFELRSLIKEGHLSQAQDIARELVRGPFAGQPGLLRTIAIAILDADAAAPRDLDLALEAARDSVTAGSKRDSGSWSVLARTHFQRGELAAAIDAQGHAVDLAEGRLREHLHRTLESYRDAGTKPSASPGR